MQGDGMSALLMSSKQQKPVRARLSQPPGGLVSNPFDGNINAGNKFQVIRQPASFAAARL
jgi:hypothetical protein